jgi:hypothetical protein
MTMLEIVVTLALLSAAVAGIMGVWHLTLRFSTTHGNRLDTQQAARRAFERVTEELRWAERIVSDPLCPPRGLCADRVTAYVPVGSPYRRDQAYDVTFQFNRRDAEIERRVNRGTNNIAAHITDFAVSYFDALGRPAGAARDVTRLQIMVAAAARNTHALSWEASVAMRNLRPAPPTPGPSPTPVWRPTPRHRFEPAPARPPTSGPPLLP